MGENGAAVAHARQARCDLEGLWAAVAALMAPRAHLRKTSPSGCRRSGSLPTPVGTGQSSTSRSPGRGSSSAHPCATDGALARPSRAVAPSRPAPARSRDQADRPRQDHANVQTLSADDFDRDPRLAGCNIAEVPGVALGDQTGNEFQRDLNYRGATASPVIGTPQGLAVIRTGSGSTKFWRYRQLGLIRKPPSIASP
jgi:hypothetical protein